MVIKIKEGHKKLGKKCVGGNLGKVGWEDCWVDSIVFYYFIVDTFEILKE